MSDPLGSANIADTADRSFGHEIPTSVLPNGLPFGDRKYNVLWVSHARQSVVAEILHNKLKLQRNWLVIKFFKQFFHVCTMLYRPGDIVHFLKEFGFEHDFYRYILFSMYIFILLTLGVDQWCGSIWRSIHWQETSESRR